MKLLALSMLLAAVCAVPNLGAVALVEERDDCQKSYSCECKGHTWKPCDGMCECHGVTWCAADGTAYCGDSLSNTPCACTYKCTINMSGGTTCNECCGL